MAVASPAVTFTSVNNTSPSIQAAGTTAATPTAGTVIATLSAVSSSGIYSVTCYANVTAAVAAADSNNIGLYVNGTLRATVPLAPVVNVQNAVAPFDFLLNVGDVITARVVANASTGAVYNAVVVANQVA